MAAAGDRLRLKQVIQDVVGNAVKYSPAGGTVQVRVLTTPAAAVLEVEDQGIGTPAETQARLFDAFYRAGNVGGQISGFGLALHNLPDDMQRQGGRIEVASWVDLYLTPTESVLARCVLVPAAPWS